MIINYTCTYDSILSDGVYQTHGDKDSFIGMVVDIAQNFMRSPMLSGKIKRNGITVLRFDYDGFSSTFFSNSMEKTVVGIPMCELWQYYGSTEVKEHIDSLM